MFKNYIKVAWRNLLRNKNYSLINITGLSLGIGCGLLIFTLIAYHLSFDRFHPNKDRIYRVVTEFHEESVEYTPGVPQPLGKAFETDYSFAQLVARVKSNKSVLISFPQGKEVRKFQEDRNVAFAEPAFFQIFDFPLVSGNKNSMLSEPGSAVLTEHMANKYFGTTDVIGRLIRLDNKTDFRITAVLKNLPANTDRTEEVYLSYQNLKDEDPALAKDDSWGRVSSSMQCFVLLRPGVPPATVNSAFKQFAQKHLSPEDAKITIFKIQSLSDIHFNGLYDGTADKKYLWAFSFVGIFLIITACVNFINLATAQALGRAKEVGVRKVMGGLPKQLFWQFISETAMITVLSVILAFGIASASLPYLNSIFDINLQLNLFSRPEVLIFLAAITLIVIFLSGSYPGLVLARFQPILALKGKLSLQHIGGLSLRKMLVIVQFTISQILIIGTLVIAAQMHFTSNSELGFTKNGIILLPVPDSNKVKMKTLSQRVAAIPGVVSVSNCNQPPASQSNHSTDIRYDNRSKDEPWEINEKDADDKYVKTFGLKIIAGRNLFPSDTAREFLVNETAFHKLNLRFPQEIIGKTLRVGDHSGIVVGVVKDFYNNSFRSEIAPICLTTNYTNYNNCAVKVDMRKLKPTLGAFEKIWNDTYPDQVYSYQFLDDRIAKFYKSDDTMLKLVELFSLIAILIGGLGLYGLISFMAFSKTKEIGIRKVLGAGVSNILWIFGKEFSGLVFIAFLVAAPVAWWGMNGYLQDFKYRIHLGPGIFAATISATFILACLSVGYRSAKAAMANPVDSIKIE